MLIIPLTLLLCYLSLTMSEIDSGKPEGYFSDCPGFNATISISEKTQRKLSVTGFRAAGSLGNHIYEKTYRLKTAAKSIAKDGNWDFKSKKTIAFFDGYLSTVNLPENRRLMEAYIKNNYNVFIFESLAVHLYTYPVTARLTKPLGLLLGQFLAELVKFGLKPEKLELVGVSMGGRTIVFGAQNFHRLTGKRPARLTGLDPSGPCFRHLGSEYSIRPDLADQVDVLHTNIDGLGIAEPQGHVDFYVNGGEYQPLSVGGFILPCLTLCSHVHVFLYWWMSLLHPNSFLAIKCNSVQDARKGNCYGGDRTTNVLGLKTDFNKSGIFYLPTKDSFPYYAGREGIDKMYTPTSYLKDLVPTGDLVI